MKVFCTDLTFDLEWIVNQCFSLEDVTRMRDEMKTHFESEVVKVWVTGQTNKIDFPKDQLPWCPMAAS